MSANVHQLLLSKPDPITVVGFDPTSGVYTAAILGCRFSADRLADAISGLHRMLGWFVDGPDHFKSVYYAPIERIRNKRSIA
jgi:hypothetical protein